MGRSCCKLTFTIHKEDSKSYNTDSAHEETERDTAQPYQKA